MDSDPPSYRSKMYLYVNLPNAKSMGTFRKKDSYEAALLNAKCIGMLLLAN